MYALAAAVLLAVLPPPPPPGSPEPPPPSLVETQEAPTLAPELPPNPTAQPAGPSEKKVLLERSSRLRKHAYGLAAAGSFILIVGILSMGGGGLTGTTEPLVVGGVLMGVSVALYIPAIATGVASKKLRKKAQTVQLIPNGIAF